MDQRLDEALLKHAQSSSWRDTRSGRWEFICPLCKTEKRVNLPKKLGTIRQWLQIASTVGFLMWVTWGLWEWKGALLFFPVWTAYEWVYRLKRRAAVVCEQCGFDPVLTLINKQKSINAVRRFHEDKKKEIQKLQAAISTPSSAPKQQPNSPPASHSH